MTHIVAWILSFVASIGIVYQFIVKWSPKARQAVKITKELLDIINAILDATVPNGDGKIRITIQELELIKKEIEDLQDLQK